MIQAVPSDAFRDAESASSWLAGQARDDAPALLTGLRTRIEAFNSLNVSPRERFKTLEALREAAFAATNEYRRQCEGRPLPLPASERKTLETALGLWRDYAQGYRHCLESFDDDTALSSRVARVAHRVSSCLRMEQLTGYSGGIAPGPGFWKAFHDLFLAAEQLGCLGDTVEDRLLGETRDSSVRGQYAMALMLYLARPFHLSGAQLAAVVRWLARWREQARIGEQEDTGSKYLPVLLDLDADWPIHEGSGEARVPRWLSLDNVQRKIRGRRSALASGESPESLRLGGEFSAEDCAALLKTLGKRLKRTPPLLSAATETLPRRLVGIGFSAIFLLLGGKGLGEAPPEAEEWFLAHDGGDELVLLRPPADEASRLVLHDLLLAGWPDACQLATVSGLWQGEGGTLFCAATPLSNGVTPRVAEIRDWADGDVTRHPALQIVAEGDRMQDRLLLPAGVLARNSGVRFFDIGGQLLYELRVAECLERVGDVEFWRISGND